MDNFDNFDFFKRYICEIQCDIHEIRYSRIQGVKATPVVRKLFFAMTGQKYAIQKVPVICVDETGKEGIPERVEAGSREQRRW